MAKEFERIILHVDDDFAILRIVNTVLSKRGFKVISVNDPHLAIQKLKESAAQLVLLDIDLPGKSGLTLLREIKKLDGTIQVFMLTGMVSMATIVRATRLGADECLFKPIENYDELGDAAERAYERTLRWWRTLREWKSRTKADVRSSTLKSRKWESGDEMAVGPDLKAACSNFLTSKVDVVLTDACHIQPVHTK